MIYESQVLPDTYGNVEFEVGELEKSIKVPLNNYTLEKPTKIELFEPFEPSNGYQLGENKVANISFVGKFLLKLIPIKKEV